MNFTWFPQIRPIAPSTRIRSPIEAMTTVSGEPRRSTGRIAASSTPSPPTKAIASVQANASQ